MITKLQLPLQRASNFIVKRSTTHTMQVPNRCVKRNDATQLYIGSRYGG